MSGYKPFVSYMISNSLWLGKNIYFDEYEKFFILMKSSISICSFKECAFGIVVKNFCPSQVTEKGKL